MRRAQKSGLDGLVSIRAAFASSGCYVQTTTLLRHKSDVNQTQKFESRHKFLCLDSNFLCVDIKVYVCVMSKLCLRRLTQSLVLAG